EQRFLCEVLDPRSLEPVADGERGELVVTTLERDPSPAIRYRTGDIVTRNSDPCPCGRTWARLAGGILAREDEMVNVRGVNVFPSAVEAVVRRFPEVVEFRSTVSRNGAMRSLSVELEPLPQAADSAGIAAAVAQQLREALGLNVPVHVLGP